MENKGISAFIKDKLEGITPGNALAMATLTADLAANFDHIKDATNASVRVNSVLKQKTILAKYTRIKVDGLVYITLISDTPANLGKKVEVLDTAESGNDGN